MKQSSAILESLVVLGVLTFGLAASGSTIISRPGPRPLPPIPLPITNRPPIIFTNRPPIRITNLPPTRISHCTPAPAGLVGWWKGEDNTLDSVLGNNGVAQNITYAGGEVGQAFVFDGTSSSIRVPASSNLDVGLGSGFTLEAWVNPSLLIYDGFLPLHIFEWNSCTGGDDSIGVQFGIAGGNGEGNLYANIQDTNAGVHVIMSAVGIMVTNAFQHVALTYDKTTGEAVIYRNGVVVATNNLGVFTPQTSFDLYLGVRPCGIFAPFYFAGLLDEPSIYNRALSADEIASIYQADSAGKCTVPPVCVSPPSGLVGWWQAEGNANDVIGGNNGILEGGATFAPGMVGQGFRLDGTNSYVQIPDAEALKPTNVTVEAWVWLDPSLPSGRDNECIVFKKNTWSAWFEGYSLIKAPIDNGNGTYTDRFQFVVSRYGNQVIINSQTVAQRGVWYHVAATYDGNQSILYVNGVAEASATPGFALDYDTTPVYIGTTGTWAPYLDMFGGIIDEISIYNRALSSNEIADIYDAGRAGKCPPVCVPPPSGLVGWWPAESNATDVVGGNNGVVQNITYTAGVVGSAFACDPDNYPYGTYAGIQIPDSPAYMLTNSLSIEGWVRLRGDSYCIFWRGDHRPGMDPYLLGMSGNNYLKFQICDPDGNSVTVGTTIAYNQWIHVAATLDGGTDTMSIYTNGVLADQVVTLVRPFGDLIPGESPGVGIGNVNDGGNNFPFIGDIDEISLYNRALTTAEIQSIYNAGAAGKCVGPFPPAITVQPVNQTTVGGSNVVLSVVADGTGPFSYQWSFNGTNISGATNATLSLTNLHPYQTGCYTVTITTPYGSTTSSCATVTVIAQNILIYKYSGVEKVTTAGQNISFAYSGQMFFIPDTTSGTFVGWGTIRGKKQYWVNPLLDYMLITIPGTSNQTFTVLGQAGQAIDADGHPHIWSYLHKGKNASLTIATNNHFSFPNKLFCDATRVYPDSQTGNMILSESSSIYTFVPQGTQTANNKGQTMTDLVNALTQSLAQQSYQKQ